MKIRPLNVNVLVKMIEEAKLSPGGISLINAVDHKAQVIDVGPEAMKKQEEYDAKYKIQPGDIVWLPRGNKSGEIFKDGPDEYVSVPFSGISCKIEED